MGRIQDIFNQLRSEGRRTLIPYLTCGSPDLDRTAEALLELERRDVRIVELGIPFSDPIADGHVISQAMHQALENGVDPSGIMEMVRRLRPNLEMGLVAMVSMSIVHRMGGACFIRDAADAGFDGFIIPDADLATAGQLADAADQADVSMTFLVAPDSDPGRTRLILDSCRGWVYLLARRGLTGATEQLPDVSEQVAALRTMTDLPIAVGFGISNPEQVRAVVSDADAAIVGSAIVRLMETEQDPVTSVMGLVDRLVQGLDEAQ